MPGEIVPDDKGLASLTFGEVVVRTRNNFPDPRYHPSVQQESRFYHKYGFNPNPYKIWTTADGIGTKPEMAERLFDDGNPRHFRTLGRNTFAMIEGDVLRNGNFLYGITHILDYNTSEDQRVVNELASGTEEACNEGGFALMNGETAELRYRTSGYGKTHLNWNAAGVYMIVEDKQITGEELAPGMLVVGLREKSLRSNGYSTARKIAEAAYLQELGFKSKNHYINSQINLFMRNHTNFYQDINPINLNQSLSFFDQLLGHNFEEQVLLPWHKSYPELAETLLVPSTLYGKVMWDAQGGLDGPRLVEQIDAAHISGGGVVGKGARMVEKKQLGLHIEPIIPDPEAVTKLMALASTIPEAERKEIIDDRKACQEWNRGVGFMSVVRNQTDADLLIEIARAHGQEAAVIGEVISQPVIEFHGHSWTYQQAA